MTQVVFEDNEKIVYEILGDVPGVPAWILVGGDQVGQCMLRHTDHGYVKTTMYHGLQLDQVENKIFIVKIKYPKRINEVYGISFEGTKTNILSCYNEGQWEISLSDILDGYPNLNQVPELKAYGKKYAVPGLVFDTASLDADFNAHKPLAIELVTQQLQSPGVIGFIERESTFQWHMGIPDYSNLKNWIPIRLLWNKIKENAHVLANHMVQKQQAGLFAHNIESSRVILKQVIEPFCVEHNITRLAEKHNLSANLHAQQQWMSIELSKIVRNSFVKAFQHE